jgi:hypothetical protein
VKLPARSIVTLGIACAAAALGLGLFAPAVASACNVPVFRYALERWRPDPYRVTVFHRGPLTPVQQRLLDRLEPSAAALPADAARANLTLRLVDVDKLGDGPDPGADRKLLAETPSKDFPRLVVQYPESLRIAKPIVDGPLSAATIESALASPLRTELVRRLAAGQTAVWLLLESGDKAKDEAAAKQLTDELQTISKTLELPELSDAPEDNLLSSAPLGIEFSLLRVSRNVATERALVDTLLASEPDLHEFKEPMVFPVFGRGRALLPLVGAGITKDNINQSAEFLVGACSCEVKELNPGFDLLLAADWETLLFTNPDNAEAARLAAAKSAAPIGKPELVAIPAGNSAQESLADQTRSATQLSANQSPPAARPARQPSVRISYEPHYKPHAKSDMADRRRMEKLFFGGMIAASVAALALALKRSR